MNDHYKIFFALLRAGLWEKPLSLAHFGEVDFPALHRMAREQTVLGLVAAGLNHVVDKELPEPDMVPFGGDVLKIEHQNQSMYLYTAKLFSFLQENDVHALLIKGPAVAQCYEKPLWRLSGDLDLLLDNANYERAKRVLSPLARKVGREDTALKHLDITIGGGVIELHGTLHTRLSKRIDRAIDALQSDSLHNPNSRTMPCGETFIPLPAVLNDVLFVFTHILHHFFIEGVGLRQICDWCRMLYSYRDSLDVVLLEKHLTNMRLMDEWRAFGAMAVHWLDMPSGAMPFYDVRYKAKGDRIIRLVLASGNFGHRLQRQHSSHYWMAKFQSIGHNTRSFARIFPIFPYDTLKFFFHFIGDGFRLVVRENKIKSSRTS